MNLGDYIASDPKRTMSGASRAYKKHGKKGVKDSFKAFQQKRAVPQSHERSKKRFMKTVKFNKPKDPHKGASFGDDPFDTVFS